MDDMEENEGCSGLVASIWAFAGILIMLVVVIVVASVVMFALAAGAAV